MITPARHIVNLARDSVGLAYSAQRRSGLLGALRDCSRDQFALWAQAGDEGGYLAFYDLVGLYARQGDLRARIILQGALKAALMRFELMPWRSEPAPRGHILGHPRGGDDAPAPAAYKD